MKKMLFTFMFSLFSVVACVFALSQNDLSASAVNDFSLTVEELTAADSTNSQAGDFKVTVSVENNEGFATVGMYLLYDSANFSVVTNDEGKLPCLLVGV